jgi:hypothetical protein
MSAVFRNQPGRGGIRLEMRRLRTRMMFFKTYKAANADCSEQRRNEAFAAL